MAAQQMAMLLVCLAALPAGAGEGRGLLEKLEDHRRAALSSLESALRRAEAL
jgi:hypothetical protein